MAVEYWRPFRLERLAPIRELLDAQTAMSRLFDPDFGLRGRAVSERAWTPAVDIYETKDDLVVTVELPGVKEKDLQLSIVGDTLSLRGHRTADRQVQDENYYRIERWSGSFERSIQLPFPVRTEQVRANYHDGVLEIQLPKVEEIKPREIKIEVG